MLISTLFVGAIVGGMLVLDLDEQVLALLNWMDTRGGWTSLLFVLVMACAVVLLVPGLLFTTGAGFVFGVVKGTAYVVVGTTLGAVLAFLISRHLFGGRARRYVLNHPRLRMVNDELTPQGWKIVMMTRMVPFFPFKLSNYFFGLTQFSLKGFAGGTLLGLIPISLNNVYLGSIAADLTTLGTRTAERTPLEWGLYGLGLLMVGGAVVYLGRLAQRALKKPGGRTTTDE